MKTKNMIKRVFALAMAFALVLTLGTFTKVSAATATYSITINNGGNDEGTHTYKAYQIFNIEYDEENDTVSVNGWGTGVNSADLLAKLGLDADATYADAAKEIEKATTETAKKALAEKISECLGTAAGTSENNVIANLAPGYYFVQDASAPTLGDGANSGAYTRFMLKLVQNENVEVSAKADAPSVVKKVFEDQCKDSTYGDGYNDVADYETGEDVSFKLIATLPSNVSDYETYKLVFNDTLASVFGAAKDVVVKVGDTTLTTGYTAVTGTNTLTVTIADLIATVTDAEDLNGATVEVTYTAELTTAAVPGTGYENEVYLEYSNNPNHVAEGTTPTLGETPVDKVIVFTYGGTFSKVDADNTNKKLDGAKFVLKNAAGKYAVLDNGTVQEWVDDIKDATEIEATDGEFAIAGLDSEENYKLHETVPPVGYSLPDEDVTVSFDQAISIKQNWNGTVADAYTDADDFTAEFKITNSKITSTLPTTGGIGTKVFYVVGAILMLGAAILLITRKRATR